MLQMIIIHVFHALMPTKDWLGVSAEHWLTLLHLSPIF